MHDPTLVLLPGLLCDAAAWRHQFEALSALTACEVASYGDADAITAMARAVLAQVPAGPLALAGHSMGGRVALEVARLAPERLQRIALLDTGTEPLAAGEAGEQERAKRMALLERARREGMRAMGREWARGMVHPARLDSPVFEDILDMIERSTPERFEAQQRALLARPDVRPVFASLRCPTLLVCGRQDAWSPLARHEQMRSELPQARLVVIEDAGHMSPMEQPEAVTRALREWLEN
ncbi:alpha/beta fold hydrolase [Ramlibacter rhizophilus]|uniref:Alpha/beta hydrolase n=1 Tax=Ramlibacter rhizophilus TaxID=1781167 RepID=A0A4Z0C0C6_9BURK|nr:alpha/beta hydrolase [Ramlibacter rhizophilus]TFZ04382.1 alpha/beta hydrolase [Ramlibacter rhizophilus]